MFILYTYWHSAIHLLLYVFPSIPQTGFRSLVHLHNFSILQGHSPSHEILAFLKKKGDYIKIINEGIDAWSLNFSRTWTFSLAHNVLIPKNENKCIVNFNNRILHNFNTIVVVIVWFTTTYAISVYHH
jgi:hypothetical protein